MSKFDFTNDDYNQLQFFSNLIELNPPPKLQDYKRNIILLSGLLIFILVSGLETNEISLILLKATIKKPIVVPIFVGIYLVYNFIMFISILNTYWQSTSLGFYKKNYAKSLMSGMISKYLNPKTKDTTPKIIINPKIISFKKLTSGDTYSINFEISPNNFSNMQAKLNDGHPKNEEFKTHFSIVDNCSNTLKFEHEFTERDNQIYRSKKKLGVASNIYILLEFCLPIAVFSATLIYTLY